MESYEGERVWGHNVDESFYAQHQLESLNLNNTILQEVQECGTKKTDLELRALLGCFLFGGDEIDKKIKVLSGGEKARVALTKTIISKANFLMLDEPTNHLDMATVELLAEALTKYDGSIILVSHDRYFISKTANKIWEIEDEQIIEFKGDYTEWVEWKERMAKQKAQLTEPVKNADSKDTRKQGKQEAAVVAEVKPQAIDKDLQKQIQKLQKAISQIEHNIETLHTEKAAIEVEMANPATYADPAKMRIVEKSYQDKNALIRSMNKEYEIAFNDLLILESK
jgi:ATP-binding cassette subfamily F protein 3